jgi:hypothetical protein
MAIIAGCDRVAQKPAAPSAAVWSNPWQPPDGPGQRLVSPMAWRATGIDRSGLHWEGYLTVEHAEDAYLTAGYFEWGTNNGGRYHFKGTFDPETRRVRWVGYTVEEQFGRPGIATYEATVSADGRRLEDGTWSGICVPGTWSAELVGVE